MNEQTKEKTDHRTKTIEVLADGKIICYKLTIDGSKHYMSYNPVLLEILKKDELIPFNNEKRLRFNISKNKKITRVYLYDLAFATYHGWITDANQYLEQHRAYSKHKKLHGLTVDHADGQLGNNTAWNLSLMTRSENGSKNNIVSRVRGSFSVNSVYTGDGYRVRMSYLTTDKNTLQYRAKCNGLILNGLDDTENVVTCLRFLCKDAMDYVDCLHWLTKLYPEWAKPMRSKWRWLNQNAPCRSENTLVSMIDQWGILQEEEKLYNTFHRIEGPQE